MVDVLLPFLTAMCNASLREGNLPQSQRHAIVQPHLKKSSLDPSDKKNYRPVSNLTFMSKVVERMVAKQLTDYFERNNLLPELQSAYRRGHSTETALLCVVSDLLQAVDSGLVTLLGLLDLSAAFDTVDHATLLHRLEMFYGLCGSVHRWFRSYIDGRSQFVRSGTTSLSPTLLLCGVPQGPILFLLYTAADLRVLSAWT